MKTKYMRIVWAALLMPGLALANPQRDQQNRQDSEDIETETFEWSTGHAQLGVMVMALTPELRAYFGAPHDSGLLVARVQPNGPAARAGVRVGDVITKVDNDRIKDATDIMSALPQDPSQRHNFSIEVVRDHNPVELQATMGKRQRPQHQQQDQGAEL